MVLYDPLRDVYGEIDILITNQETAAALAKSSGSFG